VAAPLSPLPHQKAFIRIVTAKDNLVARARSALVRRVDPLAARRAATLAERRTAGIEQSAAVDAALDATSAVAVRDLAQKIKDGGADLHDQAALAQLVEAYLTHQDPASMPHGVAQAVAASFEGLWQPVGEPVPEPPPFIRDVIRDQFHRLYYHVSKRTWKDTWYRGVRTYKCPTDMWVYMELIDQLEPGLVIETGTYRGGSALYIADRLETIGAGNVVTVDVNEPPNPPEHPRITYLTGSSTDPAIVEKIAGMIPEGSPVLVILDSDHSRDHVAGELAAYAPLVPVGSYLIVEDTNVNGHPAAPDFGPGPMEALWDFMATDPGFEVDAHCERYFLTQNPSGYLKRVR
jgi:cephalosporin hydroxylase